MNVDIPKSSAELIKNLNINEYELVTMLTKRVREFIHGAKPLVDDKNSNLIETAISELLSGKIKPHIPK